jgi:trans-aconitate 2-methyltransferase
MWDAKDYLKFSAERARPFADLLAQIRRNDFRKIADLGCGPGNVTRVLADRWPTATVIGVDNSPEMLAQATALALPGRMRFVEADIATWHPPEPVDLLISSAALQWVNDHDALLARLAGMLAPGGWLAVQMPNRFQTPMHLAIEEAAADPRWASQLQGVGLHRHSVMALEFYVHQLHDLGFAVNAWETTYVHVLHGDNPALEWLKGTALRPLLAKLVAEQEREFLEVLGRRLKSAYPARGGVTLFAMPRMFFVASPA